MPELVADLAARSDYAARRAEIAGRQCRLDVHEALIALTRPVKFGISFTLTHLNQAGALVPCLHTDRSVHLNHGGTEMGQGLNTRSRRSRRRSSARGSVRSRSRRRIRARCRTPRRRRRPRGPISTGWRPRPPARPLRAAARLRGGALAGCSRIRCALRRGEAVIGETRDRIPGSGLGRLSGGIQLSATGCTRRPRSRWDRRAGRGGGRSDISAYGAAVTEVALTR